jgi:hypothetical protein
MANKGLGCWAHENSMFCNSSAATVMAKKMVYQSAPLQLFERPATPIPTSTGLNGCAIWKMENQI